ncbi:MAG TPA: hypothetical protein PKO06_16725 [Candidatus Ozemobacteraceae bacterium]|nr:hypothetical protein [Candidatus Ozemobacteraceae bacterium]
MELLIIVCSSTMKDAVEEVFDQAGISSYTRVPEVVGSGKGGGTRLNDEIWPGVNTLYLIAPTLEQAKTVKDWVREYRREDVREGLKVFSLAAQEIM